MTNMNAEIKAYEPQWAAHFAGLNKAWLKKYFEVEPVDEALLSRPEESILNKGGSIYFALVGTEVAGTFALMQTAEGWELGKMAVAEAYQGKGIGQLLLQHAVKKAREAGAGKLLLYSHTRLEPALHIYRKAGFKEVPLGSSEYKRSNIKMEKSL